MKKHLSASKILSFLIAIMGFAFVFKFGSFDNIETAGRVLIYSFLISGLLIGNKTIVQAVEKFIEAKFSGGSKDEKK